MHNGQLCIYKAPQNVTWDTSNILPSAVNQTGLILFGYLCDPSGNEQHPLAFNFPIKAGSVLVDVPDITLHDDYLIVLFVDSGNTSPKFTIAN
ncbi:hypothetical protein ACG7TL_008912 [Trametes sanguinea]